MPIHLDLTPSRIDVARGPRLSERRTASPLFMKRTSVNPFRPFLFRPLAPYRLHASGISIIPYLLPICILARTCSRGVIETVGRPETTNPNALGIAAKYRAYIRH
jgi:hypothetical protein